MGHANQCGEVQPVCKKICKFMALIGVLNTKMRFESVQLNDTSSLTNTIINVNRYSLRPFIKLCIYVNTSGATYFASGYCRGCVAHHFWFSVLVFFCRVKFFLPCVLCVTMLPVSVDCPFLISPLIVSKAYFSLRSAYQKKYCEIKI